MLTVNQCMKRIKELDMVCRIANPTPMQAEWIEHYKRLKVGYAIEMGKALRREEDERDERTYFETVEEI